MIHTEVAGQNVVLGALLHDIGKFAQRAGVPSPPHSDTLDERQYGRNGAHAKWSADFVERFVPEPYTACRNAVLAHHLPRAYEAKIIALADHLAASEREDAEPGLHDPRAANLVSVFAQLQLPQFAVPAASAEGKRTRDDPAYPLYPLLLHRNVIFPGRVPSAKYTYPDMWQAFTDECAKLHRRDLTFPAYLESLVHLLEKYTWCVPSAAYQSRPDISLFDHARVTAAIAACLWQSRLAEADLDALPRRDGIERDSRPRFSLLCGDLSGVQRFLYTITARGAARGLRGRSLYLQLLTEAAARHLLDLLQLPTVNQIYVGGGRFYLLTPLLDGERLAALRHDLDERFHAAHQGQLALVLAAVPITPAEFTTFHRVWERAGLVVGEAKQQRFSGLIVDAYDKLFAPQGKGGPITTAARCDYCGEDVEEGTITGGVLCCPRHARQMVDHPVYTKRCDICREEVDTGKVDGSVVKCETCLGFEDLGHQISRLKETGPAGGQTAALPGGALYLTISTDRPPADAPGWQRALAGLGYCYTFGEPLADRPGALIYRINNTAFLPHAHGFRFLNLLTPRVNEATLADWPRDEPPGKAGDIKSFRVLSEQSVGLKRLGVLRMDIDSLGLLFARGLGEQATLSRLATLSRMLRLFFEGWLNDLGERVERDTVCLPLDRQTLAEQDRLYAIYTGGDDLFVVGSWDRLPLYAQTVRTELQEFAADNPAVTISAGLVLAEAHLPLYQSAMEAKDALDDGAKEHRRADGRPKNAISLFGQTLGWEEFGAVDAAVRTSQALIQSDAGPKVPRAFIGALAAIAKQYAHDRPPNAQLGQVHYGRWCWLTAYSLQRQIERLPAGVTRDRLTALVQDLRKPHLIPHIGLIARWTEFLTRTEENDAEVR